MSIHIQIAGADHAPAIVTIKTRVWPHDDHVQAQVLRALQKPDHAAFIAVSDDKRIAGFVDSFPTADIDGRLRWEIDLLAVHPDFQGQKIGQRLIEVATQAGRDAGVRYARALIQIENIASQGAFRRCGYATNGQVYRLMISSERQAGAVQAPNSTVLIPVVTMNYSGLWLEGTVRAADLEAGKIECTRRGLDLVGVLIRETDTGALPAAERAGYSFIEAFQWWERDI
jgi:ribosomal protein S18 acetylase RimI-like enzyme